MDEAQEEKLAKALNALFGRKSTEQLPPVLAAWCPACEFIGKLFLAPDAPPDIIQETIRIIHGDCPGKLIVREVRQPASNINLN